MQLEEYLGGVPRSPRDGLVQFIARVMFDYRWPMSRIRLERLMLEVKAEHRLSYGWVSPRDVSYALGRMVMDGYVEEIFTEDHPTIYRRTPEARHLLHHLKELTDD